MLAISVWEALRDAVASTKAASELLKTAAPTAENVPQSL